MLRNTIILLLILSALLTLQGRGEEMLPIEVEISVFPREVAPGDTCYVKVKVTNNSDYLVLVRVPQLYLAIQGELVQFSLSREGKTWHGTFECDRILSTAHIPKMDYHVASGETIVPLALSLQFPPLDELHTPFWEEVLEAIQGHPEGLAFDFQLSFPRPFWDYPLLFDKDFREKMNEIINRLDPDRKKIGPQTNKVSVKLRNAEEMAMIEQWYQNTPTRYFPVIEENGRYLDPPLYLKRPSKLITNFDLRHEPSSRRILGHNPWYFITIGNRYPGDPNNPTTWQGWKELEESITPSTMRDEIRLTRLLIQYCDTEDDAVLKELKDWFADMNEVQRACMAQTVRCRASGSNNTDLFIPFCDLYHIIREYDITNNSAIEMRF